jgi:hypothetical protein
VQWLNLPETILRDESKRGEREELKWETKEGEE